MSFISRSASRFVTFPKQCLTKSLGCGVFSQSQCSVRPLTRSLVVLSTPPSSGKQLKSSNLCSCGCGVHGMHTKGSEELVNYLKEEIQAEKKSQSAAIPSTLDGFAVKREKAELTLTKSFNDETITISVNVNHSVKGDENVSAEESSEPPLMSKPDFEVDVKVGSKILSFTCQYNDEPAYAPEGEDAINDSFGISELTVYEGEFEDKIYCASGDILDGMMYDLLLNYLEERGVTCEFVDKVSELCTNYEHHLYVGLLENVESFLRRK